MARDVADGRRLFLATLPAGRRELRLALTLVLVSVAIFLTAVPFARVPLAQVWAFIPIYESALVINDLITAVLLFGQFSFLRSRALLMLASGYLFTAFMAVSHALTFPGLFSPTGLLGAGPQSTAWLYMFWHGGFPLLVIAYALLKDEGHETSRPHADARVALLSSVAAVLVIVCGLTLLTTAGQDVLPAIMLGNHYTPAMTIVVSSVWALSLLALAVLWRRRPHAVLDLWLMVVMCAWVFDIALAAVLNAGRFDLGFYAGRIYGLLAASLVLMVLLIESGKLYVENARAFTALRDAQEELVEKERVATEARQEAQRASRAKSEFLSRMSHELRTPLNAILGFGQVLEMDQLGPEQRENVIYILKAGRHLLGLIDEVLDIARIEAGRLSLSLEPVHVKLVLDEARSLIRPLAAERNIRLQVDALEPSDLYVLADRQRLKQVLLNLLSNAVKYSHEGETIALACREAPEGRVRFRVSDTGPGIPPEKINRLFTPFERLGIEASGIEGTGLGLALSKGLMEAMGGAMGVESTVGRGSTFWIELAKAQSLEAESVRIAESAPATAVPRKGATVLYVEDNLSNVRLIERVLARRPSVKLLPAMKGTLALELAREHRPDLILLDLHLPDIHGSEVLHRLQEDPRTRQIPVVVISADASKGGVQRLLTAGARDYLTKPIDVRGFLRVLDETLTEREG